MAALLRSSARDTALVRCEFGLVFAAVMSLADRASEEPRRPEQFSGDHVRRGSRSPSAKRVISGTLNAGDLLAI